MESQIDEDITNNSLKTSMSDHSSMEMGAWQYAFFFVPIFGISSAYWNWKVAYGYTTDIKSFWTRTIIIEAVNSLSAFSQIIVHFLGMDTIMVCIWSKTIQAMLEFAGMWSIYVSDYQDGVVFQDGNVKYSFFISLLSLLISVMARNSMTNFDNQNQVPIKKMPIPQPNPYDEPIMPKSLSYDDEITFEIESLL